MPSLILDGLTQKQMCDIADWFETRCKHHMLLCRDKEIVSKPFDDMCENYWVQTGQSEDTITLRQYISIPRKKEDETDDIDLSSVCKKLGPMLKRNKS